MNRHSFIGTGVAAGALVGSIAAPAGAADGTAAVTAQALDAFRSGVSAKHRQAFGSITARRGTVLHHAANSIAAYANGSMDPTDKNLAVAVVLFGPAVALALDDAFWKSYIDEAVFTGYGDAVGTISAANPYSAEVRSLIAGGAAICVCNNALTGFATSLGKKTGTNLYPIARAAIINGGILVPAGVAAVNALQEARFTYLQSA